MLRNEIKNILKKAVGEDAKVEYPITLSHGDYATNVAMKLKKNPEDIISKISSNKIFEKVEANKGFINFFVGKEYLQNQIKEILKQGDKYGELDIGKREKVQVEFISANPTGPLTLGNGRGGFCGDVVASVLTKAGYKVEREYYVNDRGEQVRKLGHSIIGDDEAVYKGEYIDELRKKITGKNVEAVGEAGAEYILENMIKPTVSKMGIKYDVWFRENSLYQKKEVEEIIEWLKRKKLAYEKDNALWFKSSNYGDEKDRVLIKEDKETTYLASDIAYLKNKKDRGFKKILYFWGADHHGYIDRLQAAGEALGFEKGAIEIIIMQLVKLFKDGKEQRMSKREGVYVTLDELIDEVGIDATRFFFLARTNNTHLNFDMNLAKEQSNKNPVYYVQYAHARISSILRSAKGIKLSTINDKLLVHPSELALVKQLIKLPEVIEDTAKDYQTQRLTKYSQDIATAFHKFYADCRVIDEKQPELTQARLSLASATQVVLKNILSTMGISAPEKM